MEKKNISNKQLIEEYRSSVIKFTLSSLSFIHPGLGVLGNMINESVEFGNKIKQNRINSYLEVLADRMNRIEHNVFPKEYVESEEFYELNVKSLESALKTSDIEKQKIISNLFFKSINPETNWEEDLKNIFFEIINSFSMNHFYVLRFLLSKQGIYKIASYEELFEDFCQSIGENKIDIYQFRLYCRDIENKSIIRFSSNIDEIKSDGGYMESESSTDIPSVILTSLGEKFIEILEM